MKLFITHESALAYWLGPYCKPLSPNSRWTALPSSPLARETIDTETLARKGVDVEPLHISVGTPAHLIRRRSIAGHVMSGVIPAGSFEPLANPFGVQNPDIRVATPELAFCQSASARLYPEAVLLGYHLCAQFRPNPITGDPDKIEPVTTSVALQRYVQRYGARPGAAMATRVATNICPGAAASQMEIALAMLLTLPRKDGGYGLPQGILNGEVTIPGKEHKAESIVYHGDMVWPKQRLVVEYDSNLHHRDPAQLAIDAERRNNMQDAGWRVATITWSQVQNPGKLDVVAAQLARALGVRNGYVALRTAQRRADLRRLVLPHMQM